MRGGGRGKVSFRTHPPNTKTVHSQYRGRVSKPKRLAAAFGESKGGIRGMDRGLSSNKGSVLFPGIRRKKVKTVVDKFGGMHH